MKKSQEFEREKELAVNKFKSIRADRAKLEEAYYGKATFSAAMLNMHIFVFFFEFYIFRNKNQLPDYNSFHDCNAVTCTYTRSCVACRTRK